MIYQHCYRTLRDKVVFVNGLKRVTGRPILKKFSTHFVSYLFTELSEDYEYKR